MKTLCRLIRFLKHLSRKTVKGAARDVLIENIMEIRTSHIHLTIALERLKNKMTHNAMIETICTTACETERIGKALKNLQKEGF